MKTLLSIALATLVLGFTLPALADKDRGYNSYYDRGNWHVPRHNFRQDSPHYRGPWIYHGVPRYYPGQRYPGHSYHRHGYPGHDYRRHDHRGPYYGPGYRGHDRHYQYRGSDYPRGLGGLYLLDEILHHDQHHYPRR